MSCQLGGCPRLPPAPATCPSTCQRTGPPSTFLVKACRGKALAVPGQEPPHGNIAGLHAASLECHRFRPLRRKGQASKFFYLHAVHDVCSVIGMSAFPSTVALPA